MKRMFKLFFISLVLLPFAGVFATEQTTSAHVTPYIEKLDGSWVSLFNASHIEFNKKFPNDIKFQFPNQEYGFGRFTYLPDVSSEQYAVYSIDVGSSHSNLRLDKALPGALEYGNVDSSGVFTVTTTYIRDFSNDPSNVRDNKDPEQMFDGGWKSVDGEFFASVYKNRTGLTMMKVSGPDVGGSFYLDLYWHDDVGWIGYGMNFSVYKKNYIDPHTHEKNEILILNRSGFYAKTYVMHRQ